jgi:hypothetical protein
MSFLLLSTTLSLLLLLQAALSRERFSRTFAYLALFFVGFFYMIPLWIAAESGSLRLAGAYFWFDKSEVHSAALALLVFCVGFAAADGIIRLRSIRAQWQGNEDVRPENGVLEAMVAAILIGLVVYAFYGDLYIQTLAVRRDEAEMSYVFATLLISAYYVGCFYVLKALNRDEPFKAFAWTVLCLLLSVNFVGRASLLLLLSLPVIHYVKRSELSLILLVVSISVFLPLISQGKEIVYAIMTGGKPLGIIADAYSRNNDLFDLFGNSSHPVISFMYAPVLIHWFGGFHYFWDVLQGILFYLRLVGIDMGDSLTYYNTEAILHVRQSIVPPGYMAFGYVQAGMFGVLIAGMIYRYLGFFLGKLRTRLQGRSLASDFYLAFLAADTFYVGEPRTMVLTLALPVILLLALLSVSQRATEGVAVTRP